MNIDQLNALSDAELNRAVKCKYDNITSAPYALFVADYCNTPNYYMPIAIEHGISIIQGTPSCVVWCDWDNNASQTDEFPKNQTGRAICIAFLLMNGDSND